MTRKHSNKSNKVGSVEKTVKDIRRATRQLKEALADQVLENRLLKKRNRGWGRRYMRYSASEKTEIKSS